MAFGQASGPPASARQVAAIVELLVAAGYDGLREARHPFGLTQRQANGTFTQDEADELIGRLEDAAAEAEAAAAGGAAPPAPAVSSRPRPRPRPRAARAPAPERAPAPRPLDVATAFPDELLADELVRRGWTCTPPTA